MSDSGPTERIDSESDVPSSNFGGYSSPRAIRRIVISLMFPSMLMPMVSSVTRVALPIIRDDFHIQADETAWISVAFSLPFMILMPLYSRLGDGLGKRRLILAGIFLFAIGTCTVLSAENLNRLVLGRVIQGIGLAGMSPLSMALISSVCRPEDRGRTLGNWSVVGPAASFAAAPLAGFLIGAWGWRAGFAPLLIFGIVALWVVYRGVPPRAKRPAYSSDADLPSGTFLGSFDWGGAVLLSFVLTGFTFFLSSRAVTGVASLRDWRLLVLSLVLLFAFWRWEKGREKPFVSFSIFRNAAFCRSTFCASMRMLCTGGVSFLIPLYLVDIHQLGPLGLGGFLLISSGAMTLIVRFGGRVADRSGSFWPATIGLGALGIVILILSQLPESAPIWTVAVNLMFYGLGGGLMLAALHRAVMHDVSEPEMGSAAGLYSMFRFLGSVIGTALAGVILQHNLDGSFSTIESYQRSFLFFTVFPALGVAVALGFRDGRSRSVDESSKSAISGSDEE